MNKLEWRDEFNIGVPAIDKQHKKLVGMINALADNLEPTNIFDTVMEMSQYADEHFDYEEQMMFRCGCDQLHEHKQQHLLFRQKTSELAGQDYTNGQHDLDAFNYLCEWLINHILTMDVNYKYCFLAEYKREQEEE